MKEYLERRNSKAIYVLSAMKDLRDREILYGGPNAKLFTNVVSELSYRVAALPEEHDLCPMCENPIPKAEYDHYCGFCGQFLRK